jgi:suppressor of tumorigenicity protein 13
VDSPLVYYLLLTNTLHGALADKVVAYITELLGTSVDDTAPAKEADQVPSTATSTATEDMPPLYESGEDYDVAADAKQKAADFKSAGDWTQALECYTQAVMAAPPSALLYANRAACLIQLERYEAAVRDCDEALKSNPDSAKALRMRGKARKALGQYDLALADLSASQAIDFDEGTVEDLKFLTEKRVEAEKADAAKRNEEEEKLRKRAQEIKKAQEEAKREAAQEAAAGMGGGEGGGMPFPGGMGGMPGGMAGMPGMAEMSKEVA